VGPTDSGWRRDTLCIGDGEWFLVNGEKNEAIENLLEKKNFHFIPCITFFYWGGDKEAARASLVILEFLYLYHG
jgi:hypothetical protein